MRCEYDDRWHLSELLTKFNVELLQRRLSMDPWTLALFELSDSKKNYLRITSHTS
jgi:hypothetical protein